MRRFIPNFVDIVKPINKLLKKETFFKWDDCTVKYFEYIKEAIMVALVLIIPYFTKYFVIFSFTSKDTIVGVLFQKNEKGDEKPISFMRKVLGDADLNYTITK